MIILKRGAQRSRAGLTRLADVGLSMERMNVDNYGDCIAAVLSDDHPRAAAVRVVARKHPHYKLMPAGTKCRPIEEFVPPARVMVEVAIGGVDLTKMALTQGWTDRDLDGTNEDGNPGLGGGRSHDTGLTLADMTVIKAPENWPKMVETNWPWQLADWKPPSAAWPVPVLSDKIDDAEEDDDKLPEVTELGNASAESSEKLPPPDTGAVIQPDDTDSKETVTEGDEVVSGDPAVAAGYPADEVDQARAMAHALAAKKGGTFHPNSLNFLLKKADLSTVGKAELEGLLALP